MSNPSEKVTQMQIKENASVFNNFKKNLSFLSNNVIENKYYSFLKTKNNNNDVTENDNLTINKLIKAEGFEVSLNKHINLIIDNYINDYITNNIKDKIIIYEKKKYTMNNNVDITFIKQIISEYVSKDEKIIIANMIKNGKTFPDILKIFVKNPLFIEIINYKEYEEEIKKLSGNVYNGKKTLNDVENEYNKLKTVNEELIKLIKIIKNELDIKEIENDIKKMSNPKLKELVKKLELIKEISKFNNDPEFINKLYKDDINDPNIKKDLEKKNKDLKDELKYSDNYKNEELDNYKNKELEKFVKKEKEVLLKNLKNIPAGVDNNSKIEVLVKLKKTEETKEKNKQKEKEKEKEKENKKEQEKQEKLDGVYILINDNFNDLIDEKKYDDYDKIKIKIKIKNIYDNNKLDFDELYELYKLYKLPQTTIHKEKFNEKKKSAIIQNIIRKNFTYDDDIPLYKLSKDKKKFVRNFSKKELATFWILLIIGIIVSLVLAILTFLYILSIFIAFTYAAEYERMRIYFTGKYYISSLIYNSLLGPIFIGMYKSVY